MPLKMSSGQWRPVFLGLDVLKHLSTVFTRYHSSLTKVNTSHICISQCVQSQMFHVRLFIELLNRLYDMPEI